MATRCPVPGPTRPPAAHLRRSPARCLPRGVVTPRSDPEGRRTISDVTGDIGGWLAPVGRLDAATSGLLLLTNVLLGPYARTKSSLFAGDLRLNQTEEASARYEALQQQSRSDAEAPQGKSPVFE